MSLTIKSLNGDTTFLLSFSPSSIGTDSSSDSSKPFTILLDPWINVPINAGGRAIAWLQNKLPACVASLNELPAVPDLVLINQPQPDHCNRGSLCQLPPDTSSKILAVPGAASIIRGWKHFERSRVVSMKAYKDETTIYRFEVPSSSASDTPAEITVTSIQAGDIQKFHNAMCITYRTPTASESAISGHVNGNSEASLHQHTISVVYSPHGVLFPSLKPWIDTYLSSTYAPNTPQLTALITAVDRNDYPWWLGGNVVWGKQGALDILRNVDIGKWVASHDVEKDWTGWAIWMLRVTKYEREEVIKEMKDVKLKEGKGKREGVPELVDLGVGQEVLVA